MPAVDHDLLQFSLGVAAGAAAAFVPWIGPWLRERARPCASLSCPHHGPENRRRVAEINEAERRRAPGPPRPPGAA